MESSQNTPDMAASAASTAASATIWTKVSVNGQNVVYSNDRSLKIKFPHKSDLDGFCFWISRKLVRQGRHSYELLMSIPSDFKGKAQKMGQGRFNRSTVIAEKPVGAADIIAAFGGPVELKPITDDDE